MAMSTGGERGGLNSEINVTPLVDVMLVLLIIMMLIAPILLQPQGAIRMPAAANTGEKPDTQRQTVVAIDSHGVFYVDALPVPADSLVPQVRRVLEARREKIVYLKGDKDARYSAVMGAMDALRNAEIENIALITEKKDKPGGGSQ